MSPLLRSTVVIGAPMRPEVSMSRPDMPNAPSPMKFRQNLPGARAWRRSSAGCRSPGAWSCPSRCSCGDGGREEGHDGVARRASVVRDDAVLLVEVALQLADDPIGGNTDKISELCDDIKKINRNSLNMFLQNIENVHIS